MISWPVIRVCRRREKRSPQPHCLACAKPGTVTPTAASGVATSGAVRKTSWMVAVPHGSSTPLASLQQGAFGAFALLLLPSGANVSAPRQAHRGSAVECRPLSDGRFRTAGFVRLSITNSVMSLVRLLGIERRVRLASVLSTGDRRLGMRALPRNLDCLTGTRQAVRGLLAATERAHLPTLATRTNFVIHAMTLWKVSSSRQGPRARRVASRHLH